MEHFKTGNNGRNGFIDKTDDFSGLADLRNASLDTTGSNGAASGNREYVLDGKKERLILFTGGRRNIRIDSIHQFENALTFGRCKNLRSGGIRACFFKRFQSGPADDGNIVAGEAVRRKQISHVHFNEVEQLVVVNKVHLVHEHYDVRNADLTGEQDMLTSLRHRTVRCGNDKDSAVHLSSTRDHVLDIVGVPRTVDVRIVTFIGLILDVRGVDCDTAGLFFGRLVDFVVTHFHCVAFASHNHRDSCGQSSFTVVNVADGTNVNVGFASVVFSFSHNKSSNIVYKKFKMITYPYLRTQLSIIFLDISFVQFFMDVLIIY